MMQAPTDSKGPKIVISGFDYSATMVKPWADAGFLCYCVDWQHPPGAHRSGNIIKVGANLHDWDLPHGEIFITFWFPPCTDVAVSGARWMKDKGLGALITTLQLFKRSIDLAIKTGAPYMIENPVNTVSTYWRDPDHRFDPCDYGDPYTKKTCLWVGQGFIMPPKTPVEPERVCSQGSWIQKLGGKSERTKRLRSATPPGFAQAVFQANRDGPRALQLE